MIIIHCLLTKVNILKCAFLLSDIFAGFVKRGLVARVISHRCGYFIMYEEIIYLQLYRQGGILTKNLLDFQVFIYKKKL